LQELGYRLVIYPAHALFMAVKQIESMFADLRDNGTIEPWLPRMVNFSEWKRVSGVTASEELERRYEAAHPSRSD
jgi:2-methylisocitrate lyase-like PEP mutase family enzyme